MGNPAVIERFDENGVLTEIRTDVDKGDGPNLNGYLNASTWLGSTFVQLNSKVGIENRDLLLISNRVPQIADSD